MLDHADPLHDVDPNVLTTMASDSSTTGRRLSTTLDNAPGDFLEQLAGDLDDDYLAERMRYCRAVRQDPVHPCPDLSQFDREVLQRTRHKGMHPFGVSRFAMHFVSALVSPQRARGELIDFETTARGLWS